jgi:hypothetical protein
VKRHCPNAFSERNNAACAAGLLPGTEITTHVGHSLPMGVKQATRGRKLATVAQPCGYPIDGQMDCLHHALVGLAGPMTLQQFDL